MKPTTSLAWILRESRGARWRMLYFAFCLAAGVAAVVGTAALASEMERGFRARSRELLGADFRVESRRPIPPELAEAVAAIPGSRRADLLETPGLVASAKDGAESRSGLATLRAVSGPYPLYGEIETQPPGGLGRYLARDTVVVASPLADSLGVSPGDGIRVGGVRFRLAAVIVSEPVRLGVASLVAPSVYLTRQSFDRTERTVFGTRREWQALFALPGTPSEAELDALVARLGEEVPGAAWLDFDTHYDQNPGTRRSTRRAAGFVGLMALLSLVVGGIGVALIVRAWMADRTPAVAVMRCLGSRPSEILLLSVGHVALLAFAGSLVGAAVGAILPFLARAVAPELLGDIGPGVFPLAAVLRGIGLGTGLALVFSLPPMTAIWRVPPARVLRSDAEPLPRNRIVTAAAAALLAAGVFLAASVQAAEVEHAIGFTLGFALLVGILLVAAKVLLVLARRLPRSRLPPSLKHGIAALARPGAGTAGIVVALGLGTMVVTSAWILENRIREAVLSELPPDAPSVFLLDIPPDRWDALRRELGPAAEGSVRHAPVKLGRITGIDGKSVEEILAERGERSGWALRREQRLTWAEGLAAGNRIVEGELWSRPDVPELSVERRFASRIGVRIGSTVTLDVGGATRELRVTSIREIRWQSMGMSFFLVAEPGALGPDPDFLVASARLPEEEARRLQDRVAAAFPSVPVIRVGPVLEKVFGVLARIASGIRLLGTFTALAGLAVLAGAVAAAAGRRGREVAVLKTLGVTKGGVAALLFAEYGLLGVVAGAIGAGGALLLAFGYLDVVAGLEVSLPLAVLPVAAAATGLLTGACGLAAAGRALRVRPIEALR